MTQREETRMILLCIFLFNCASILKGMETRGNI